MAVGEEFDLILQDVQTILLAARSAGKFTGIVAAQFKIRELPKVGEELDTVPCVLIAPYGDLVSEAMDFEDNANRIHRVEIALVDGHDGDFTTHRGTRLKWQKEAMNAIEFQQANGDWRLSLPSVPSVWDIRPVKIGTFDRSKLNDSYAYFSLVYEFHSQE